MRVLDPVLAGVNPNQLDPVVERGRWIVPGGATNLLPSVLAEVVADHENQGVASLRLETGRCPSGPDPETPTASLCRGARGWADPHKPDTSVCDAIRTAEPAWLRGCERAQLSQGGE